MMEDEDEDDDDDYDLGQAINEIAAQNFSEKETTVGAAAEAMDEDEELAQLREYLEEL